MLNVLCLHLVPVLTVQRIHQQVASFQTTIVNHNQSEKRPTVKPTKIKDVSGRGFFQNPVLALLSESSEWRSISW